jgi:hypothetical protein
MIGLTEPDAHLLAEPKQRRNSQDEEEGGTITHQMWCATFYAGKPHVRICAGGAQ